MTNPNSPSVHPPLSEQPGYKPSGKMGPLALPLLVVSLLLLPILASWLYHKTNHFGIGFLSIIWALIGAAALLGVVVGLGFFPAIQFGKVRNPTLVAALALLAGIATFGLALYQEALDHRAEVQTALAATNQLVPDAPVALTQSYLALRAESGLEVSGRRGRDANISGTMFWGLIGIEWLLCAIAATVVANLLASRRFSEEFNRWTTSKSVYKFPTAAAPELVALARANDWTTFAARAQALKSKEDKDNLASASVHTVPEKPGGTLQIQSVIKEGGYLVTVYEEHLTPEQLKMAWPQFPATAEATTTEAATTATPRYDVKSD